MLIAEHNDASNHMLLWWRPPRYEGFDGSVERKGSICRELFLGVLCYKDGKEISSARRNLL
jgi:hypothetical protein